MRTYLLSILLGASLLVPAAAQAQTPFTPRSVTTSSASWGLTGSFVPKWVTPGAAENWFDRTIDMSGSEFTVGVVRGRPLANQWGISYVHKGVSEGSRLDDSASSYCLDNNCLDTTTSYVSRNTSMNGVEAHAFLPFASIKQVVIGVTVAGGIAALNGDVDTHTQDVAFDPLRTVEHVAVEHAADALDLSVMPLAQAQITAAFLQWHGLELHASAGLNLPGYQVFSIAGVYFLGGR
jgi:hypothetical protein